MTRRDILWLAGMVLFTFGTTTMLIIGWQVRRDARRAREQHRERVALKLRHPARHWAIVPTPPYDWERED